VNMIERLSKISDDNRAFLDGRYYEVVKSGGVGERVFVWARNRIYSDFLATCSPAASDSILDVGISDVLNDGANVLERLYPHPEQITACGLGEAPEFQEVFPLVKYRRVKPHQPLPFGDKSFDIATSNAVLEHVGSRDNQARFVKELVRLARRVFITVPHRFFPIEHHTAIPLAHWTNVSFRVACTLAGKKNWARENELILMSSRRLSSLVPPDLPFRIGYTGVRLGPFSSNLFLTIG
jgi:SAM-dependent methyltransferase